MTTIGNLILEANEAGYDVEIRVTKASGETGRLTIPMSFAAKLADAADLDDATKAFTEFRKHNAESNASLIAAAPEMYDALIAVERTLRGNDLYDLRKVDFALAKARGEHE